MARQYRLWPRFCFAPHRALIFSQFVDHLSILRNYLDGEKISYQYLDGSTPIKERKERINNFQNGSGDVFLISLKAGGAGLNLTAADYVIHMDPWWNCAGSTGIGVFRRLS